MGCDLNPHDKSASELVRAGLERAMKWDRQKRIRRIQEDEATAEHDKHDDGYDIYPDPYCRICREDGLLTEAD